MASQEATHAIQSQPVVASSAADQTNPTAAAMSAPMAKLNPAVKAFEGPRMYPGPIPVVNYGSQSAPASPDRVSFDATSRENQLRQHLSYYFSEQNLIKDGFLVSHMSPDAYVPCQLIANFPAVAKLTNDVNLVVDLLRGLTGIVQVSPDGSRVRPVFIPPSVMPGGGAPAPSLQQVDVKPAPGTIIIRESIPADTPVEDVAALFVDGPTPSSVKCDMNIWLAEFDSEDATQEAFRIVSTKQYNGKPIKARIKSAPSPRASSPPYDQAYNPRAFQQGYFDPMAQYAAGYGYVMPYGYQYLYNPYQSRPPQGHQGYAQGQPSGHNSRGKNNSKKGKGDAKHRRTNSDGSDLSSGSQNSNSRKSGARGSGSRANDQYGSKNRKGQKAGESNKRKKDAGKQSAPPLLPENFPALPGGSTKPGDSAPTSSTTTTKADNQSGKKGTSWNGTVKIADIVRGIDKEGPKSNSAADPQKVTIESTNQSDQQKPLTNSTRVTDQTVGTNSIASGLEQVHVGQDNVLSKEIGRGSLPHEEPQLPSEVLHDDPKYRVSVEKSSNNSGAPWGGSKVATAADIVSGKSGPADIPTNVAIPSNAEDKDRSTSKATASNNTSSRQNVASTSGSVKMDTNNVLPSISSSSSAQTSTSSATKNASAPWGKPSDGDNKPTFAEMLRKKDQAA